MSQDTFNPSIYSKAYLFVKQFVLKNSGNFADFEDILQDGLCIYFKNIQTGKYVHSDSAEYYICKICINLWHKELEKRKKFRQLSLVQSQMGNLSEYSESDYQRKESLLKIVENNIRLLSIKCQQVFQLKKEGFTTDQIAEKMGFKNQQISKDKTFRCKKRLKELIHKDIEYLLLVKDEK